MTGLKLSVLSARAAIIGFSLWSAQYGVVGICVAAVLLALMTPPVEP